MLAQSKLPTRISLLLELEGFGRNADIFLQEMSNYGFGKFMIL